MRRARNIVGLPIVCIQTGKRAGKVFDLIIDEAWHITGIILGPKGWLTPIRYIVWNDLVACGEDAVTIQTRTVIKKWKSREAMMFQEGKHRIKGLPIMTANGNQLGIVEDVYFDTQLGTKIIGFEISEGFISDLTEGRKWLALPNSVTRGDDALIVPVHCEDEVTEFFVSKEE